MAKKKTLRIAVIGTGGMAKTHMKNINDLPNAELSAVCDVNPASAQSASDTYGGAIYTDHKKLLKDDVCDAVLIATPHYFHTTIGVDAFKANKHVLTEKPISVHKADCEKLIKAKKPKLAFGAMFQMRTAPPFAKAKELIESGELGKLQRINWIITDWFRSQAYYNSGGWRATWKGEGGGVLLNQCPHNLDMMYWLFGMPSKVTAQCGIGKYHDIEVEDEVSAMLEYKNGATGVFVTSTGELPGTNRLEIAGDKGKLVIENGELKFYRNEFETSKFVKQTKDTWPQVSTWDISIPTRGGEQAHKQILTNFVNHILNKEKLLAPGIEGVNSVELGNAMLYSHFTGKPVEFPLSGKKFETLLNKLIKESEAKKSKKKKTKK